jgi:hypothetical protein
MNTFCQKVKTSIEKDQTWTPSILMPSSIWSASNFEEQPQEPTAGDPSQSTSDEITLVDTNTVTNLTSTFSTNFIDIIHLFQHYEKIKSKVNQLALMNSYPDNVIFHFENYHSFEQKNDLITAIKDNASHTGTYLVTHTTRSNPNQQDPSHHTILACKHYGQPEKSTQKEIQFKEGSVQATHTLIEPQHHGSSTNGSSRSQKLKRTTNNPTKSMSNSHMSKTVVNKCHTIKCGCKLRLIISYHHKSK